jgi:thiaminase
MIHQLAAAHQGGVAETQAAVLACQWGYGECCRSLIRQYGLKDDNPYHKWFEFHTSDQHLPGLNMSLALLDRHAARSTEARLDKITEIFMTSVQLETMLWD